MTIAAICVSAYLIVGGMATALIWAALRASKQQRNGTKDVRYKHLGSNPFQERKTKPGRFQS